MQEVNKYLILISAILEINGSKIKFNEIYNYTNQIYSKLSDKGYNLDKIDDLDIIYFCEACDTYLTHNKGNIISVNLTKEQREQLKDKYINNLSEEIKELLKYEKKYILPVNTGESIDLYLVEFKNKELIEKIKENNILASNIYCEYLLNLQNINNNFDKDQKTEYFKELFRGSLFEKRISYKIEYLEKIIDSLYLCMQPKFECFNNSTSDFKFNHDELELAYTELYEIYTSSFANHDWLEKIELVIEASEDNKQKVYK